VIIFTGYGSKDLIIESLRRHADDFLEKPLDIDTTLNRIKQLLNTKLGAINGIIAKLKYFIEKNFHKDISLNEASQLVCLSPKYISKIFKKDTGIGFNAYKLQLKMDKAKEMLDTTTQNINEIAAKIGYHNTESFVKIFKKLVGTTPTLYRQKTHNK